MLFKELDNESRRRLIDTQQRGDAFRTAMADQRHRFAGSMAWKDRGGKDYLYRRHGRVEKSLGPRSTETEVIYNAFCQGKARVEQRAEGLRKALEGMARVNRAMGIGRVPRLVARILRRLDDAGVLGNQVCVVGTNALFAYEAHAGIHFESGLLATNDIDFALDARRNLSLTATSMPDGLIGLLRKIDPTFAVQAAGDFRAVNATGLMVDLITPEPRNRLIVAPGRQRRLGGSVAPSLDEMTAVEVPRLGMIVDAPRFSATAVAEDGLPVWLAAADPRWWAAHKLWLAAEPTRDPLKRQRDRDQGAAVSMMLARAWDAIDLSDTILASMPRDLRRTLREAVARGAEQDSQTEW